MVEIEHKFWVKLIILSHMNATVLCNAILVLRVKQKVYLI